MFHMNSRLCIKILCVGFEVIRSHQFIIDVKDTIILYISTICRHDSLAVDLLVSKHKQNYLLIQRVIIHLTTPSVIICMSLPPYNITAGALCKVVHMSFINDHTVGISVHVDFSVLVRMLQKLHR